MVINHQNGADSRKVSLIAALPLRFRCASAVEAISQKRTRARDGMKWDGPMALKKTPVCSILGFHVSYGGTTTGKGFPCGKSRF